MVALSTCSVLLIIRQGHSQSQTQVPGATERPRVAVAVEAATGSYRPCGQGVFNKLHFASFFCLQRGVESQEDLWHLPVRSLLQQKVGGRVETPWGKKTRFQ